MCSDSGTTATYTRNGYAGSAASLCIMDDIYGPPYTKTKESSGKFIGLKEKRPKKVWEKKQY